MNLNPTRAKMNSMKIVCIGTGFVGVVTAAVMANLGHEVIGLDIDQNKIEQLKKGTVPFYEPGLSELLISTQKEGSLNFTTDYSYAVPNADLIFLMVGTPSQTDGSANLDYLFSAVDSLAPHLKENAIVIIKSTVPPGTNKLVKERITAISKVNFHLASVPEFLKEGTAVEDTLHPDRIVLGIEDDHTRDILLKLHQPLTNNLVVMNLESAQMTKYAANNYLATRITFINQIADLCEHNGADIEEVIRGIGFDHRIGSHYWYPGLGYGGSCFPKDVKELSAYAKKVGEDDSLFIHLDRLNTARIPRIISTLEKEFGTFKDKSVAVLGLAFKPNTNDTREAPANYVIPYLTQHGAKVITVDPKVPADTLDPYQAISGASVVMILTEWPEYKNLDLVKVKNLMKSPFAFFDSRNLYDPAVATKAGLLYRGIGR